MKIHTLLAGIAAGIFLSGCSKPPAPPAETTTKTTLFNGTNLENWSHVLVGDGLEKEEVWSVSDSVLICKGKPTGYLFTNSSYQDFKLNLEWRWAPGSEPGNSGVLLRIAGEPETFMPKCVEAQLKHENAGDIWGFYGTSVDGPADRIQEVKDHKDLGNFKGVKKIKAAEKAPGEWNRYEIKFSGGNLELKVNGELVNQATGLDIVSGPIGLQSEGAEIHFRNIYLEQNPK